MIRLFLCLLFWLVIASWKVSADSVADVEKSLRDLVAQGDLDAMNSLSRLISSKGTEFHAEALSLLFQAAKAGYAPAQYNLSVSEFNGDLGTQDRASAWMWMKLASLARFDPAPEMLQLLSQELTPAEISKGQELLLQRRTAWNIEAARDGNVRAAIRAGMALLDGKGIQKDEPLGLAFLKQAADAGQSSAMLVLAARFENGRGVSKNLSLARDYYLMACRHRLREAMHEFARFLYRGIASEAQPVLAAAWLNIAMSLNYEPSFNSYASLSSELSSEQLELATKLAALGPAGLADSGWFIGKHSFIEQRFESLQESPWPHDLFTNQSNRQLGYLIEDLPSGFREWRKPTFEFNDRAARDGQVEAIYNRALTLLLGLNGIKNLREAIQLLEEAGARGYQKASSLLGFLTVVGPGVELESAHEMIRLEHLTERSDSEAQYLLGKIHQLGLQGSIDLSKARVFYEKASDQGHLQAREELARFYSNGLGGDRNDLQAWNLLQSLVRENWPGADQNLHDLEALMGKARIEQAKNLTSVKKASVKSEPIIKQMQAPTKNVSEVERLQQQAEKGLLEAQYRLAQLYFNGEGTAQSFSKAFDWYNKAASQGHAEACFHLAMMQIKGAEGVSIDYEEARKWLLKASEKGIALASKELIKLDISRGEAAYQAFDNKKALDIFEGLKKLSPDDRTILLSITKARDSVGLDLFNEGKQEEAEKVLISAMESAAEWQKKYPNDAQAYVYLAVTTGNLARFKGGKERVQIGSKVEGYCLKAIETDANVGRPYVILATYYWEVSKLNWMLKAFAKSFLGKLPDKTREDALQLYLKGLEKDSNQIYGHFKIAQLYDDLGNKDKANEHRRILLSLKAKNSGDQRILDEVKKGS